MQRAYPSPRWNSPAGLTTLPDDVLLQVMYPLHAKDILSLRKTCKRLAEVTKERWLWYSLLKYFAVEQGLPIPGPKVDVTIASSQQLEARALNAWRFHENWTSENPRPGRDVSFDAQSKLHWQDRATVYNIRQIAFLPGKGGNIIITLIGPGTIACWEVPPRASQSEISLIAVWNYGYDVPGGIDHLVCSDNPDNQVTVVVAIRHSHGVSGSLIALHLDIHLGLFEQLSSCYRTEGEVLPVSLIHQDWVLAGCLNFWNWRTGTWKKIRPVFRDAESNRLLCAKYAHDHFIIVRQKSIHLVRMPSDKGSSGSSGSFRVSQTNELSDDAASEAVIHVPTLSASDAFGIPEPVAQLVPGAPFYYKPVMVLLRCKDNNAETIKSYTMSPFRADYSGEASDADTQRVAPESMCYISRSGTSTGTFFGGRLPSESRKQFMFPLVAPTVACTVNPSSSGLLAGSGGSGKGLWLETREVTGSTCAHESYPARCLVGFSYAGATVKLHVLSLSKLLAAFDGQDAAAGQDAVTAEENEEIETGNDDQPETMIFAQHYFDTLIASDRNPIFAQRVTPYEVSQKKYKLSSVALEDSNGRVAIGYADGTIQVLDFA